MNSTSTVCGLLGFCSVVYFNKTTTIWTEEALLTCMKFLISVTAQPLEPFAANVEIILLLSALWPSDSIRFLTAESMLHRENTFSDLYLPQFIPLY